MIIPEVHEMSAAIPTTETQVEQLANGLGKSPTELRTMI